MKAGPELRSLVRFQRLNLVDECLEAPQGFDLVLCRNVLIYFRPDCKMRVVERLLRHLAKDGLLLLGHAESMAGLSDRVRAVGPNCPGVRGPERQRGAGRGPAGLQQRRLGPLPPALARGSTCSLS